MKKRYILLLLIITAIFTLMFFVVTNVNMVSFSATTPKYSKKDLQNYVVSTAISYYYNNQYTDYEGVFRDKFHSEFPTMYNLSPEMISRSRKMTTQCEAFATTCYMQSLNFDFSKYYKSLYSNKYTSYVAKEGNTYKRYFSNDSIEYFKISNMYFSKSYSVASNNNIAKDIANGIYSNDNMVVLTYQKGKALKGIDGISDTTKSFTEIINGEGGQQILNNIVNKLEPGDIILNDAHAMLWVGNIFEKSGGAIHSSGISFALNDEKFNAGYDEFDVRYSSSEFIIQNGIKTHGGKDNNIITIIRPINLCVLLIQMATVHLIVIMLVLLITQKQEIN